MTIRICDCCKKPVGKDYDDEVERRTFYIARTENCDHLDLCVTCYASISQEINRLQDNCWKGRYQNEDSENS